MLAALALLLAEDPAGAAEGADESAPLAAAEVLEGQRAERERRTLGAFAISGEIVFGWRAVEVGGSKAQFDEDVNLDTGPVLRELRLEGERASGAGALESWLVSALGIGDPRTSYRAELESSALAASGRYDRSRFEANAEDGLHGFDFEREAGALRFEPAYADSSGVRGGVELTWLHRDALGLGTRGVDFGFVSNVATRKDEESFGLGGDLSFRAVGWNVALDASGRRLGQSDRRDFSEPSPSDPGSTQTEDFDADLDGHALATGVRATRRFGHTEVDLGAELALARLDGDLHSFETGILLDPALPFERDTTGESDMDGTALEVDAGFRHEASEELAWLGRVSRSRHEDDDVLFREIVLDEFSGPPTVTQFRDRGEHETTLELLEGGAELALSPSADLTLLASAGREDVHVFETMNAFPVFAFDGTFNRWGGEATLELEPSRQLRWTLSAGHEVAPESNTLVGTSFDFLLDRGTFGSVRAQWKPVRAVTLTGLVRHQHSESEAFGAEGDVTRLVFGASVASASGWIADGSLALRRFDLAADTTVVILSGPPTQVPATARFEGTQASLSGSLARAVTSAFHPRLAWSAALGSGDGDYRYAFALADFPYRIGRASGVGVEVQLTRFDAHDGSGPSDFDAAVGLVYLRTGF